MMDNRNGYPFPREASGRNFPGSGSGMNRRGTPAGRRRQDEEGGRFLAFEPEDYDGGAVPIADPPVPGAEDGQTDESGQGPAENAPGTCGRRNALSGSPLAMVYAPDQIWQDLYEDEEALGNGTLFRELDFPFCPGCRKSGRQV